MNTKFSFNFLSVYDGHAELDPKIGQLVLFVYEYDAAAYWKTFKSE